jgi:hypothetical protein
MFHVKFPKARALLDSTVMMHDFRSCRINLVLAIACFLRVTSMSVCQTIWRRITGFFFPVSLLPLWSIGLISQFLDHSQSVGLLGQVISSSQGLYLNTGQHKHRKTHTHTSNIQALSEIRTHDPSFRASKDSACLRPRGHRDRLNYRMLSDNELEGMWKEAVIV